MTIEKEARSNATLADQLSYKESLPKGVSYMENNGFLVMAETEDGDEISLVSCIFRVGGGKKGPWQVEDKFVGQTTFQIKPKDFKGTINDLDFISNRSWATDDWNSGEVIKTNDAVIWKLDNRQYICRPPYWELKGEHMGIEFDLLLSGNGDASFHKGIYADLAKNNVAGYEAPLCCEGTFKVEGKTYKLRKDKSVGCQEKFTQPAWDLAKVLRGETYYWIWWANESVRIFIYYYPSVGKAYSHVMVDDQEVDFSENGTSNIKMEELEYWIDPKTRMRIPVKWHFTLKSAIGEINLDASAESRTFYGYLSESGATIHYGLHSHSLGEMNLADGRKIALKDMRTYIEHGWCAIPLPAAAC
ncbi:MAG: hypothetical protein KJ882_11800 [Proteobacteria bacterium]|nr:hypothetical protein [Pseudomonadota bacterium]MBU4036156.1 hypothetical protein [Pseudomonadota bacterium]